jgi:transcriptional regulator with XRE-family HTH domain
MSQEADRLHRAIGRRVRELRDARETLSQERLAELAGFHRTFIGKVERGETATTVDSLAALCSALALRSTDKAARSAATSFLTAASPAPLLEAVPPRA